MARIHSILRLFTISIYLIASTVARDPPAGPQQLLGVNEFPYLVSVQAGASNGCTGAIISDEFIITTAHCLIGPNGKLRHQNYFVIAGTVDLRLIGFPAVIVPVEKIYVPVEYAPWIANTLGDIAVLKLRHPLYLSKRKKILKKVSLPNNQRESYENQAAVFAGFGQQSTIESNTMSNQLRFSDADILSNDQCQEFYKIIEIGDKHICAKIKQFDEFSTRGIGISQSGGLLIANGKTAVGILSRGPASATENNKPAIYTRISHYLTFIHNAQKNKMTRYIRVYELSQ